MPVKKGKGCVADVMREWKSGKLHSGEDGPVVKDKQQAVAIALSMCGGAEKAKNFVELASDLLKEVRNMPSEFDLGECTCDKKKPMNYGGCDKSKSMNYGGCGCPNCRRQAFAIGYPTPSFDEEEVETSGAMALAQLRKIVDSAAMLMEHMSQDTELEPWVSSKITLAEDYISSVADYVHYNGLDDEEMEMYEEKALKSTYAKGLTEAEKAKVKVQAEATMKKGEEGASAKSVFKPWATDEAFLKRNKGKMPKSKATLAYERMYGNDSEDMGEGGASAALKEKSEKSGISVSILRQVFERGMAAWKSGHRPGVPPQQWALGRVNSFVTGSGGARKADSDLWKKTGKS